MKQLICAVTVLAVSIAQADVIYVDAANCPGPGNGTIGDPYCSIQTAIDHAVDTDEIVVAPGTYFETINFLGKAIWLHSSSWAEVTTIDAGGDLGAGSVLTCESGEGSDTVLEGFAITGGSGTGFPLPRGGGMYNSGSSPTVINCTFTGNSAFGGGGMWNGGSDPTLSNCTFSGNTAMAGGAGMENYDSSPTVTNCTFTGNLAVGSFVGPDGGGGMFNSNNSNPALINCTFSGNTAGDRGGGVRNVNSSPTVTDCTFIANAAAFGGGMANTFSSPTVTNCTFSGNSFGAGGGMFNVESSPTVTGCTFNENSVVIGGGMGNHTSSPTVINCTFIDNAASNAGGGMLNQLSSSPTLTNCTFSANSAHRGGGMRNDASSPTVINCTFSGNSATTGGGGMDNNSSSPTVTNCILWDDSPDEIFIGGSSDPSVTFSNVQGGFPGIGNIDADPLFVDPDNGDLRLQPGSPCIDAGDNTAVPGDITTDLDGNPRFLEIPETPDTGNGTLPIVDMGAFESLGGGCLAVTSQEVVCHADGTTFTVNIEGLNACTGGTTQVTFTASGGAVGEQLCFTALVNDGGFCCTTEICVTIPDCTPDCDLNGDGIVGIVDYLSLFGAWGSCSDCGTPQACPADFDGDCSVGILDMLVLLANWT